MRRLVCLAVIPLLLIGCGGAQTPSPEPVDSAETHAEPSATDEPPVVGLGETVDGVNLQGSDIRVEDLETADPAICQARCQEDESCVSFTYVRPGEQGPSARCWLKSRHPPASWNPCCVSGRVR